ncbi:MAG: DUF4139 domain-containing protein [Desulfovibrionales bacterium]|nr:DUF4139 domain-containing protein [Desulfovibrionales bacterium]
MRIYIFLTALLFMPMSLWAVPISVTLFPDSGQIEEHTTISAENAGQGLYQYTLVLPGQADPSTLRIQHLPDATVVNDMSWTWREEKNQAALAPLMARLQELEKEQDRVSAEAEGLRGRLAFWKAQSQPQQQSITALHELAAEMSTNVRADALALRGIERQYADLDAQRAAVQAEIDQAAGQLKAVWDVRVLFAGQAPKELTYAYVLHDCGWSPIYRLDARPEKNQIDFSWQARVWQRSGTDWTNARLFLATVQPEAQAIPADLPPWEIRPLTHMPRQALAAPAMLKAQPDTVAESAPPAPQEIRRATYALWDLGQQSMAAGQTRILALRQETWPATFAHLVRPALSPQAFVQATTTFAEPQELPPGKGYFLMQGAMLDQREFSFAGTQATVYFGTNPLVTARSVTHTKQSGEKGFLASRRSYAWDWSVHVKNDASYPISLRVEEPRPLSRDERIKIDIKANPSPIADADPSLMVWNSTLATKAEQRINITVNFQAPDDLAISPGWRW